VTRLLDHIEITSSIVGRLEGRLIRERGTLAELYSPLNVVIQGRGWSIAYVSLGTIGICWLGLNGAVFAALATRKSRLGLRARLFNWVIRNELRKQRRSRPAALSRVSRQSLFRYR
jgi:hypothetical protein